MKYHNCKVAKLGDSSVAVLIIAPSVAVLSYDKQSGQQVHTNGC